MQQPNKQNLPLLHTAILKWYAQNGRLELQWRNLDNDTQRAYKVYVSEIMLQQTQVQIVIPYFARFIQKFPNLQALANAKQEEVLRHWQGLGYYTRARNMHAAAKLCGQSLPQTICELLQLPGIGRYTAGAIMCFGFLQPVSFVDANIKRVLSRLFALQTPSAKTLEDAAQMLLNKHNAFAHNQALLDIGALVCLPKNPLCNTCPLAPFCVGKAKPSHYPAPKPTKTETKTITLACVRQENCIALVQSRSRLYYGLYNLPEIPSELAPNLQLLGEFKHSYTRYRLSVRVVALQDYNALDDSLVFVPLSKLDTIPLSSLCRKALHFACQSRNNHDFLV